jgi:uncharacterized protein YacL
MKNSGYKQFFKFMVLMLGILFANLITMWIDGYMMTYKLKFPQYTFTWIGMAVIVVIYYPLFTRIDKWATRASDKFMRVGKKVVGREIGAILAFIGAMLLLFYLYGLQWFHTNVFKSFIKAIGNMF